MLELAAALRNTIKLGRMLSQRLNLRQPLALGKFGHRQLVTAETVSTVHLQPTARPNDMIAAMAGHPTLPLGSDSCWVRKPAQKHRSQVVSQSTTAGPYGRRPSSLDVSYEVCRAHAFGFPTKLRNGKMVPAELL